MSHYCLCLRKNDKNLLHILTIEELGKPFYSEFRPIKQAKSEEEAFLAVEKMVRDFCTPFWDKGQNPDFQKFKAWAWKGRDMQDEA